MMIRGIPAARFLLVTVLISPLLLVQFVLTCLARLGGWAYEAEEWIHGKSVRRVRAMLGLETS